VAVSLNIIILKDLISCFLKLFSTVPRGKIKNTKTILHIYL
jgi:hypothetical protein